MAKKVVDQDADATTTPSKKELSAAAKMDAALLKACDAMLEALKDNVRDCPMRNRIFQRAIKGFAKAGCKSMVQLQGKDRMFDLALTTLGYEL